jgi:hypothetical protein
MDEVRFLLDNKTKEVKEITVDGKKVVNGGININLAKFPTIDTTERAGCEIRFKEGESLLIDFEVGFVQNIEFGRNLELLEFTPKKIIIELEE